MNTKKNKKENFINTKTFNNIAVVVSAILSIITIVIYKKYGALYGMLSILCSYFIFIFILECIIYS